MIARPATIVVVAGTGTEVGKTWVAARLAAVLRRGGTTVAARKPAQSFEPDDPPEGTDAALLAAATGEPLELVCPPHRWYPVAMAPPMAADALGRRRIHLAEMIGELEASWRAPAADVGLVELAGGIWSPAAHDADGLALTASLAPQRILLVADAGLGTINAVRPAAAALAAVAPVEVLLNRFDDTAELHRRNRDWLRDHDGLAVHTELDTLAPALTG